MPKRKKKMSFVASDSHSLYSVSWFSELFLNIWCLFQSINTTIAMLRLLEFIHVHHIRGIPFHPIIACWHLFQTEVHTKTIYS